MKPKFILIFSFAICFCKAQIPPGYYSSANGLTGAPLQNALHNIIDNHTSISYAALIPAFDSTDLKANGEIWDIYSDVPGGTPPYTYTNISADQCGSYNSEADCFNREHSWPQSWFNGATPAYSDLFHIYPTDGYVNGMRSNYPFGEVANPTWTSMNGSKRGPNTTVGYNLTVFEPIDEYKGDLARGYFYMSTRYMNEDASWGTSDATNKSVIEPWQLCLLLDWHHQDTVSSKEIDRNNAIYQIQNNRNPFIDHPEWVDSVFTCTINSLNEISAGELKFNLFPNPAKEFFTIENLPANATIKLYDYSGRLILTQKSNATKQTISTSNLQNGFFLVEVSCESGERNFKRIVVNN